MFTLTKSVAIIGSRGYPSYYGGFETLVRRLAPYLVDEGWDVTVYGRHGSTKENDSTLDLRVRSIKTPGIESKSLSTLSYGLTSAAHAAMKRPDVALVLNVANGFWLPTLVSRRVPTVVNVDGIEWEREKWGKNAKAVFRTGARLTARFADELVTDSIQIQNRWETEFNRSSEFIPYGGDHIEDLQLPPGVEANKYILMVARFVPENTVPEFLAAAEELSANWKIVIVGSTGYGGELDSRVQTLADKSQNVTWMGHISDDRLLFSLWKYAGVYFHGHSVGGTNPALVQAMTCGATVVARDTIFNREVLGETGVFVEPDPVAIAEQIDSLMRNLDKVRVMAQCAQARALEHYSWNGVCERYATVLEQTSIVKKNRSQRLKFPENRTPQV